MLSTARRSFSVAEVNALLPKLEQLLLRMDELRGEIGARSNELERLGALALVHEGPEPPEMVERRRILRVRVTEFQSEVDKLEELGAVLMDPDLCLLDFPSRAAGREVLLSWQRGEPRVAYYRLPGSDLLARQRIEADAG